MHPTCEITLQNISSASAFVTELAMYLGRAAEWRWQRYGRGVLWTDSAPGDVEASDVTRRPPQPLRHRAVLDNGLRWRCTVCMTSAKDLASLRSVECIDRSSVLSSHKLLVAGEYVFCDRCGLYSSVRCRGLREGCQPIKCFSQKSRLELLRKGRHPVHGFLIGKVAAYSFCEEWQLLNSMLEEDLSS